MNHSNKIKKNRLKIQLLHIFPNKLIKKFKHKNKNLNIKISKIKPPKIFLYNRNLLINKLKKVYLNISKVSNQKQYSNRAQTINKIYLIQRK